MFKRSALLALAAIFTLSLAAFTSSSASAKFGGGGGHGGAGMHRGGGHGSVGMHGGGGIHLNRGQVFRGGHSIQIRRPIHIRPAIRIVKWHHQHWRPRVIVRPAYVNTYAAVRPVTTYAVAPTATCNCLTKEYLPDGTVLFKDLCTKEMAMNPPMVEQAQGPDVQVK
jgi:hypothetical protein